MGKLSTILRNTYGYPQQIYSYYEGSFLTKLGKVTLAAVILIVLAGLVLIFCALAHAEPVHMTASWYSAASLKREGTWKHGEQKMANGRRFDERALTCAARLWPLGTVLRVTNVKTGKSVRVVVTDRIGKRFARTRVDLTKAAFARIADTKQGVVKVRVVAERGRPKS